jgi:hypothetical protein
MKLAPVVQYAKDSGLVLPIALDLNDRVQRAYSGFGPTATFFIDREGVLRDRVRSRPSATAQALRRWP